ncbi:MAG: hypothetical protein ACREDS_12035, partial [Limisphaerales bacterium]
LYQFNDPDLMVFDNGPDFNENQSRLINCAITGVFLNGSILTNSASINLAQLCLTNAAINNVARVGKTFRPVDGATGTGAADILERQDGRNWNIAFFNYYSSAYNETIDLTNAGLPPGIFVATNLFNGTTSTVSNSFSVSLNAKQAKLFCLSLVSPPPLPQFTAGAKSDGNHFIFSGTNGIPGWNYLVLASTNLLPPLAEWTVIATNVFDAGGNFNFTNSPNTPQTFYRLQLP